MDNDPRERMVTIFIVFCALCWAVLIFGLAAHRAFGI